MMKVMLICAPVTSRSGYGAHARDLVKSFMDSGKFNIKILDVNWGDTPRNALDKNNPSDRSILDCILKEPKMDSQPDVYVDIRIPNEFQTYGKFNIGITAGIETNAVSQVWLEGCNKMDLIIVPSEHSKAGFVNSIFDKIQQLPDGNQQKVGEVKLEKPIEVLFEGVDVDTYKSIDKFNTNLYHELNEIKEENLFLLVGQWCKGGFGEDRKDIGRTIKLFCEAFANSDSDVALLLKTSFATFSILEKEQLNMRLSEIKNMFPKSIKIPNIYLIHGDLTTEEMNEMYNHPKVKSLVSLTHGEGFGRPLLEATMTGLPVIASKWSGQMDFLTDSHSILLPGSISEIPKSVVWDNILIPQSKWFVVDEKAAKKSFNFAYENLNSFKEKSTELMDINREKFSHSNMTKELGKLLDKFLPTFSKAVNVTLPKLKKVTKEVKLPKLSKV